MQNRQQILDFARQMLREKRYDEARKLLRALPADDDTAQQWLARIEERKRAEATTSAALSDGPIAKARRQGRSLGELLRGSWRRTEGQPPKPKIAKRSEHPLATPPDPEPSAPPPASHAAEPDAIFAAGETDEGTPKIHPDELPVGAILARSLVLAGVVIGVVLLILLFLGG